MFYEIGKGPGEAFTALNAIVVPRPIGWISTLSAGASRTSRRTRSSTRSHTARPR